MGACGSVLECSYCHAWNTHGRLDESHLIEFGEAKSIKTDEIRRIKTDS